MFMLNSGNGNCDLVSVVGGLRASTLGTSAFGGCGYCNHICHI